MRYGVSVKAILKQWKEKIEEKGHVQKRYVDLDEEKRHWTTFYAKDSLLPDDYAATLWKGVEEILQGMKLSKVLEMGPGWGNYTFSLANRCESLDVIDFSQECLDFLKQEARKKDCRNITFHQSTFEDFSWQSYDMIFAYNCFYREMDVRTLLQKIDSHSNKIVIIGLNTSYEPKFNKEISEKLDLPMEGMGNDYILLTNYLYDMGIDVNQRMIPMKRRYIFQDLEALKKHEIFRIRGIQDEKQVDTLLLQYLKKEEKGYTLEVPFYGALIYWYPKESICRRIL